MSLYQPRGGRESDLFFAFVDVDCIFLGFYQYKQDKAYQRLLVFEGVFFHYLFECYKVSVVDFQSNFLWAGA